MKRKSYFSALLVLFILILTTGCSDPKKDWQEAEKLDTIEAYESFLQKHSAGQFADSARQRIEELEWQNATNLGTVEGYETFLEKYPQGELSEKAKLNRDILELIITKIPSFLVYEESEVLIMYDPSGELISLKYQNDKWEILRSEVREVKRGSVMIIGRAKAGTEVAPGAYAGEGGLELAIKKEL